MTAPRIRSSLLALVAIGVVFPAISSAQNAALSSTTPAAPPAINVASLTTPTACIKAINDWRTAAIAGPLAAYRAATDSTRADLARKYSAAVTGTAPVMQKLSADCAVKFNVATIPGGELMDLVTLYNNGRDTTGSRLATERLLTDKNLPPRTQAQVLAMAMRQEMVKDPSYFGIIANAEKYVAQIDALPDSLDDIKLLAHGSMLGRYEYLDVAEGLRSHATAVIALGRKLDRKPDMISGYSSLARSYADRLMPDSALRILDGAEKELGAMATERFKDFRARYALIGQKAAAVTAEWWINPDAKSVVTPKPGHVTLIEFTAHWCGPCKNSYPGLRSVAKEFTGKGFDGVMVTQLYGYLGVRQNLTPEQEVAADRVYFGEEHALPFPVAINPRSVFVAGQVPKQPQPDGDYRVGGIPQIIIVDKKGVIRQIVTGWDQGNTARFGKLIKQLLAEK